VASLGGDFGNGGAFRVEPNMTCAELIAELQKYPAAKPVRVLLQSVTAIDEMDGDYETFLCDDDAMPAAEVRYLGSHVLIKGA
jgi:hypothetical protein